MYQSRVEDLRSAIEDVWRKVEEEELTQRECRAFDASQLWTQRPAGNVRAKSLCHLV